VTNRPPRRGHDAPPAETHNDDERRWADLARLVLVISRGIQYHGYRDRRVGSLTTSETAVMCYVLHGDPAAPSQIATATGLLRPNVSAALRSLQNKGLIEKNINPADGRGFTIRPTTIGRAGYDLVRHGWAATVATAADHDSTDLDTAIAVLEKVMEGLENNRPASASERT